MERFSGLKALTDRLFGERGTPTEKVAPASLPAEVESYQIDTPVPKKVPDGHHQILTRLYIKERILNGPNLEGLEDDPIFQGSETEEIRKIIGGVKDPTSPDVIEPLATLVFENYDGKKKRHLKKFEYDSERRKGGGSNNPQGGERGGEKEENQLVQEERVQLDSDTLFSADAPSNPSKKGKKEKKPILSVRELIHYAKENGFTVTGENDGHIRLAHKDGRKTGFNKRPNTLSPGLYAAVTKTIEKSND